MKKVFLDNINQVKQRIKDGQIDDTMNALSWISLLQLTEQTNRGEFYKDFFFAIIDYDEAVVELLQNQELFPSKIYDTIYDKPINSSNGGFVWVICYDIPNVIGLPAFAVKAPYFNFKDLSPEKKKKALDILIELYYIKESDDFDSFDII